MGWFWPPGFAAAVGLVSCLTWIALLAIYQSVTPENNCEAKSGEDQLASWIVFAGSVVLLFWLSFLLAGRLRINRLASMVTTVALMLPLILLAMISLEIVNLTLCRGD